MFNYIHDYLIWNSMSGYIEIGTERAVTSATVEIGTACLVTFTAVEIGTACLVTLKLERNVRLQMPPLIFGTSTAANEIGTECAVTDAAVYL